MAENIVLNLEYGSLGKLTYLSTTKYRVPAIALRPAIKEGTVIFDQPSFDQLKDYMRRKPDLTTVRPANTTFLPYLAARWTPIVIP